MKNQFILKILGSSLFLSMIGCATRSTPPALVVNGSQAPTYVPATPNPVTATPPAAAQSPKLEAVKSDDVIETKPAAAQPSTVVAKPAASSTISTGNWQKPTDGTLGAYSAAGKGVNISGQVGQPIYAVASGKVLYSGNGLKGYGNLIIIRHDNTYLSAYAYNKINLVKEGATVQQGQKIATMGVNDSTNEAMLHLEVRKNGKPIDPHSMIGN